MLFLLNNLPFVWLAVAVVMVIIEALTMGLATIWFALAALISMVLAFFHIPPVWQILIFLVISAILIIFTRPVAVKKLQVGKIKTNAESLIGGKGRVTAPISADQKGQVQEAGQIWTATASDGGDIAEGVHVRIERIEGVTLHVSVD